MRHNSKTLYILSLLNKKGKHKHKVQPLEIQLRLGHRYFISVDKHNKWKNATQVDNEIINQGNKVVYAGDTQTDSIYTVLLELVDK